MGRLGRERKRAMTGNLAQWIRRWQVHNVIDVTVGVGVQGKRSWGSIGALMQSDVMVVNRSENRERSGVRPLVLWPLFLCFLDNFVPECTEIMLQSRKRIVYVESGKCPKDLRKADGARGCANKMDQDGK